VLVSGSFRHDVLQEVYQNESNIKKVLEDPASTEEERCACLHVAARPLILHLDPIQHGGHDTKEIGDHLRRWLRCAPQATSPWNNFVTHFFIIPELQAPKGSRVCVPSPVDRLETLWLASCKRLPPDFCLETSNNECREKLHMVQPECIVGVYVNRDYQIKT
jgi:hypothetical protein